MRNKPERKKERKWEGQTVAVSGLKGMETEKPMPRLIEFSAQSMPSANIYSKRKIELRVPK